MLPVLIFLFIPETMLSESATHNQTAKSNWGFGAHEGVGVFSSYRSGTDSSKTLWDEICVSEIALKVSDGFDNPRRWRSMRNTTARQLHATFNTNRVLNSCWPARSFIFGQYPDLLELEREYQSPSDNLVW